MYRCKSKTMMRIRQIVLALGCLALAFSCTKEEKQPETQGAAEIIATVNLPETTKLAYSENDIEGKASGLKSIWEAGDSFYALTDDGQIVRFDLYDGAGTSKGKFRAYVDGIDGGTEWTAVLGENATPSSSKLDCGYGSQNGSLAGLGDFDYTVATGTGTSPSFNFSTGTRLSYFMRIKLPAGVRYIEYCTACYWKVSTSSNSIKHDGHFDTVYEADLGSESSAGDYCYLAIPATQYGSYINENNKGAIFTFMNAARNKSNGRVISSNLSAKAGTIGTFDLSGMTLIDRPLPAEAISLGGRNLTIEKDPDTEFCNKYNNLEDYKYTTSVSPAWAPFNLGANISGATSVDDLYGEFYMWGEIAPRTTFSSGDWTYDGNHTVGSMENFPSTQIGAFTLHLVSNGSSDGTLKLQQISGTKYDAARVRWGSAWRMPTIEDLVSLTGSSIDIDSSSDAVEATASGLSTQIVSTDYYGTGISVRGRKFWNGGDEVFFPFGGFYGTGRSYQTYRGFYWSDSRIRATPSYANLTNSALRLEMTNGGINYGRNSDPSTEMYYGLNIRPVRNSPDLDGTATAPSVWEDMGDYAIIPGNNLCGTVKDSEGHGISGVTVTDGYTCVSTNASGQYQMVANANARTVSITVPAAYEIPLDANNQPAFWQPISIPVSGVVEKNFTLTARAGGVPSRFTILAVTDEHVQSAAMRTKFQSAVSDIQSTARTLVSSGIPVGTPANADAGEVICISLGDQMWDNMAMASSIRNDFCSITDASGNTIPVFYTIGNHDYDSGESTDYDAEQAFVDTFGPTNYSFDMGNAHIIVMDNIIRRDGNGSGKNGYIPVNYGAGFTSEQVSWLRADVAKVSSPASKIVVFCCHAPLSDSSGGDSGTQNDVMGILKNNFYNAHVLSGHTHCIKNNLYKGWAARSGRSIYEHTIQTLSGYFWDGDISYGIGSIAGYGVLTFGSSDIYAEYNKMTKEAPSFQFWVYNGGETYTRSGKSYSWESPMSGKFIVRLPDAGSSNDASDYWTVSLGYGGSTTEMTRVSTATNDRAVHCYIAKTFDSIYGGAGEDTDQFWYSSRSFASSGFTITATHTMPSGWSATYTTKTTSSYVKNNTFYGFGYGVNFE